jgi:hypothetical protein
MPVTNLFNTYDEAKAAAKAPEIIIVVEHASLTFIATVIPTVDLLALMERHPDGGLRDTRFTCGPITITNAPAADYGAANESTVRDFLEIINAQAARAIGDSDSPGVLQMSRLYPDDRAGTVPSRFTIGSVDAMVKEALGHAQGGHNSYIEGRTVRNGLVGKERGKLADTEWVFAFNIDSDADKDKGGTVAAEASLIVESSPGNRHYWYFLDRALRADEAQEIGRAIRKASGADHDTGNVVQPYRVAGTVNYPDAKKRGRGRYVSPTRILEHSGKLYSAAELLEAFKGALSTAKQKTKSHDDDGEIGDFDGKAWVHEGALPNDLLKIVVNGVEGEDEDRSRRFFGVVANLKRRYWPLEDIGALFERYPEGIAQKYQGRIREQTKACYDKIEVAYRPELPTITLAKGRQSKIVSETEAALAQASVPIFARSDELVYPKHQEFDAGDGRKAIVASLSRFMPEVLQHDIDRSANFITWRKNPKTEQLEPVPADPPSNITRLVLNNKRYWKHEPISGVITTPLLRHDGTLVGGDRPHYDPATRLYYMPGLKMPPIADKPTKDEAKAALDLLIGLLDEFPFIDTDAKTGGSISRSVALSALLTPLARAAMDVAPMHLFTARTAGSGKSYLVEIASTIATGDICAVAAMASNEEELEKRLSSLIMRGAPIVSLDNANRDIEDGVLLCQMLTQGKVSLRTLGRSEMPEFDCRATVYATGNNIGVVGDLTRRTLVCNLDRGVERPELHPFDRKPVEIVKADRGLYVAAALTIIKGYLAAEPVDYEPLASYGQFSRFVRGPLIWLGQPDPAVSMEDARDNDPVLFNIRILLTPGWLRLDAPYRARDIIDKAQSDPGSDFKDMLDRVAGDDRAGFSAKRLGNWLKSICGRVVDGHRLMPYGTRQGTTQYCVQKVER